MKKKTLMLSLTMFIVIVTLLLGAGTAKATLVDAVLTVTADNVYSIFLNNVPLVAGPNAGDWTQADTYNIQLEYLAANWLTFVAYNVGANGPFNPAGLLAEVTLGSSYHFAETGTSTLVSTSADYWLIGQSLFDLSIPTSWASNDYVTYGGATPIWWNVNGGNPVSGIAGEAEWIWTENNLIAGGDNYAFISAKLTPVPEPSSMMLLGMGLLSLAGVARKRFLSG